LPTRTSFYLIISSQLFQKIDAALQIMEVQPSVMSVPWPINAAALFCHIDVSSVFFLQPPYLRQPTNSVAARPATARTYGWLSSKPQLVCTHQAIHDSRQYGHATHPCPRVVGRLRPACAPVFNYIPPERQVSQHRHCWRDRRCGNGIPRLHVCIWHQGWPLIFPPPPIR